MRTRTPFRHAGSGETFWNWSRIKCSCSTVLRKGEEIVWEIGICSVRAENIRMGAIMYYSFIIGTNHGQLTMFMPDVV